jgi:hypothetical protein
MSNIRTALVLITAAQNINEGIENSDIVADLLREATALLEENNALPVAAERVAAPVETNRANDRPIADLVRGALEDERFTWRSIGAIAKAIGTDENSAREIMRGMSDVRRAGGTANELYGLRSRVD